MTNVTRRKFLVSGATAAGSVAVAPAALAALSTSGQDSNPDAATQTAVDCAVQSVSASIHIAAGGPVRTMRGGIGASFHAVSAKLPGLKPPGDSWSGSEWGGNPEADDDQHWEELFKHAEWLGLDWCRVELEQRMYEPGRRTFDWDNPEMRVLYRILDWAERRNVDVFLQQMWADVAWNAYPGNAEDPVRRLRSAPYSLAEWAYGLGELVEHLMKGKGYTCIKWVSVNNEPGHDDFSWWQDSDMKSLPITPGLKAAREEFDRRGLSVAISGPDWTDLPKLDPAAVDFDSYVGAYDLHSYGAVFDSLNGAGDGSLTQAEARMTEWARWAHQRNKPFFLSEFGTMCYGWGHWDAGPACYQSGLKNASLVVRGINAGVDGFNRWSFTNRGDLDGQWQLVRTWDVQQDKLLDSFIPQPNAYYQFAMLARFLPKHSGVLATRVNAPFLPEDRKIVATALRTAKGNLTVLVVNESDFAADVNMEMEGLAGPVQLKRYSLTKEAEGKCAVELRPERSIDVTQKLVDRIDPMSIVVYSTYSLNADDPGLIAE